MPLLPHHLWMVVCPADTVRQPVWDVVCLACVAALELGRQRLYQSRAGDCVDRAVLLRIKAEVLADFWARLRSFAVLGIAPRGWASVPDSHCFLASGPGGRVVLREPPDVESPPGSPAY